MHIDLLPIEGRYRGATRYLRLEKMTSMKGFNDFYKIYEKYLDWLSKQDNSFSPTVLQILIELRDEMIRRGANCEIICYSDIPEEFYLGDGFLGFDVFGEFSCSAIEEGNHIDERYSPNLNENGLFSNREGAQEFCEMWKQLISTGSSPWEVEENPRPFCIWLYRN